MRCGTDQKLTPSAKERFTISQESHKFGEFKNLFKKFKILLVNVLQAIIRLSYFKIKNI